MNIKSQTLTPSSVSLSYLHTEPHSHSEPQCPQQQASDRSTGLHAPILRCRSPGPHLEQAWGSCFLQHALSEVLCAKVAIIQQPG